MTTAPGLAVGGLDLAVIGLYLAGIVGLGCLAGRRRGGAGRDYFLAGRRLGWPVIGLALFATNISTTHLVSLAEEGYVNGLAYGNFEWLAAFTLVALALLFAPFYIRSGVSTLPDFLERRYGRACRDWLAGVSIFSAVFIHIGFSLYTGAVVLKGLLGLEIGVSIVAVAGLTGLYTIVGGLLAVVLTESVQTVVLLAGAAAVTAIGLHRAGGWEGLAASVEPVKLTVLRPAGDASGLPWYSILLGYPVIGIWYWCADQTIVQRVLGARDERHARLGPIFAGFIKILPVFLFVLPGLIALALVRQGRLSAPAASDQVYGHLIAELLPAGLRGLAVAALLAALMSTVSGGLNSIATLFTYDLYRRWRPRATERSLVRVGRFATFGAMVAAAAWSPFVGLYPSIFQGIVAMICDVAPPITAVFLWGVLWRRASARAALLTLAAGSVLGVAVFLLDLFKDRTGWSLPSTLAAFYLFAICSLLLAAASLRWPHRHTEASAALVWKSPLAALGGRWAGLGDHRLWAGLLAATMVVLYAMFG